jgi:hypothetical protein
VRLAALARNQGQVALARLSGQAVDTVPRQPAQMDVQGDAERKQ